MHRGLGRAVADLRARMGWGQEDLAREITRVGSKMGFTIKPNVVCISRWENGDFAPSEDHRAVLARIAGRDPRTQHLAVLFRAPMSLWRLVSHDE